MEVTEKIKSWAKSYDYHLTWISSETYTGLRHFDMEETSVFFRHLKDLEEITELKVHSIDVIPIGGGLQIWLN